MKEAEQTTTKKRRGRAPKKSKLPIAEQIAVTEQELEDLLQQVEAKKTELQSLRDRADEEKKASIMNQVDALLDSGLTIEDVLAKLQN